MTETINDPFVGENVIRNHKILDQLRMRWSERSAPDLTGNALRRDAGSGQDDYEVRNDP